MQHITHSARRRSAASAGLLTGAVLAVATLAAPAGATVIFDGVSYTYEPGLEYQGGNIHAGDYAAEVANDADRIGWFGAPNGSFHENAAPVGPGNGDHSVFFCAAPANTCANPGDQHEAILLDVDNPIHGDTLFTWTLTERTDVWDVVKIGIKVGELAGYFKIDAGGADTGTFTIEGLFEESGGDGGPLDSWLVHAAEAAVLPTYFDDGQKHKGVDCFVGVTDPKCISNDPHDAIPATFEGVNHLSFFGSAATTVVPEPGALGLLGLGLVGAGLVARRRRTA